MLAKGKQFFLQLAIYNVYIPISDLRQTDPDNCIQKSVAEEKANELGHPYCETSALTQEGLGTCFDKAVRERQFNVKGWRGQGVLWVFFSKANFCRQFLWKNIS